MKKRLMVVIHKFISFCNCHLYIYIGVASIMQLCNKISNIRGRSPYVVKVIFHTIRNCSKRKEFAPYGRKEFAPYGSKFYPLREVPILKRDGIEDNHCLIR